MADSEQDTDALAELIAWQIASSPRPRAEFLEIPAKAVAHAVRGRGPFGLRVDDRTSNLRKAVLVKVPEAIAKWQEETVDLAKQIARLIANSPRLRAIYLEDPAKAVAHAVRGEWPFGLRVDDKTSSLREQVLTKVPEVIEDLREQARDWKKAKDEDKKAKKPEAGQPGAGKGQSLADELWKKVEEGEIPSGAHAELVMEQFFRDAIRNPRLTFLAQLGFGIMAILFGMALVGAGVFMGLEGVDTTERAAAASAFSGAGVIGALSSIVLLASDRVRLANANHAQIRVILSDFATELGHLRAIDIQTLEKAREVNEEIRTAMTCAVKLIQESVKAESGEREPKDSGGAGQKTDEKKSEEEGEEKGEEKGGIPPQ